jgi:hypothetical protein
MKTAIRKINRKAILLMWAIIQFLCTILFIVFSCSSMRIGEIALTIIGELLFSGLIVGMMYIQDRFGFGQYRSKYGKYGNIFWMAGMTIATALLLYYAIIDEKRIIIFAPITIAGLFASLILYKNTKDESYSGIGKQL